MSHEKTAIEIWHDNRVSLYGTEPGLTSKWEPDEDYRLAKALVSNCANKSNRCGSCKRYKQGKSFDDAAFEVEFRSFKRAFIKQYGPPPTLVEDGFNVWFSYQKHSFWWYMQNGLASEIEGPTRGVCNYFPESAKVGCDYSCNFWEGKDV